MIIILTRGAGFSCSYSLYKLKNTGFPDICLPAHSSGTTKPGHGGKRRQTCLVACHLGATYDLGIARWMFKPRCPLRPPANTQPFLRGRGGKGIFEQPEKPYNSPSSSKAELSAHQTARPLTGGLHLLLGREPQLDLFRQPSGFYRSCHSCLYNHCSSQTLH